MTKEDKISYLESQLTGCNPRQISSAKSMLISRHNHGLDHDFIKWTADQKKVFSEEATDEELDAIMKRF